MKKLLIVIVSLGLTFAAEAQAKINRGGAVRSFRPRTTVVAVAPIYPYGGMGWGMRYGYRYSPFYSPFYDPFLGYQRREPTPSKLDLEIEDIKNQYGHKLTSARKDKSVSKQERKQKIRELKHEREDAIIEAKKIFYRDEDRNSSK